MSQKTHRVKIGNLVRELPIRCVNPEKGLHVAYFDLQNDPEVTEELGRLIAFKFRAMSLHDVLVMPAGKATPLLQAVGRYAQLPIVVIEKKRRPVMLSPVVCHEYESITSGRQMLCIGADHAAFLAGKRAAIIDDVVSTGGSIDAVKEVLKKVGASYDLVYAAFTEGGDRQNVIALGNLPFPYPV